MCSDPHHALTLTLILYQNPWINYPYLTNPAMKYAADTIHKLGMKFSVCE
jgi:hypothetical protein